MPFADEFSNVWRSRGVQETLNVVRRMFAPTSSVLENMGPHTARLSNDIMMVDDLSAKGVGRYAAGPMPLDVWDRMGSAKRIAAFEARGGKLSPDEFTRAMADPEIRGLHDNLKSIFDQANAENMAARDPSGKMMQVRNPFT